MRKHPYLINPVNAGTLGFTGNMICQNLVQEKEEIDWHRTLRFVFFCTYYQGVISAAAYRFYAFLKLRTMTSSLVDNFIHVPLLYMPAFFITDGLLEGKSLATIVDEKKGEYKTSLLYCVLGWTPFQWFNFKFIPQEFQVVSVNVACLVWNVVLDYVNQNGAAIAAQEKSIYVIDPLGGATKSDED